VGWLAADLLLAALAAVIVLVTLTGGGAFSIAGRHVSVRSVGNPIMALLLLGGLRWWLAPAQGFLGIRTWDLAGIQRTCVGLVRRTAAAISAHPLLAVRLVVAAALLSMAIKVGIAIGHPGFFSGDDVEIHEMTLGHLFNMNWPAWELRSAFYPMAFIYPVQAGLASAGIADVEWLVIAGRVTVAALSSLTVWLLFVVARRHFGSTVAVPAALILAFSHLYVTFGATELPRPVCALFVLAGFAGVMRGSGSGALVGGAFVGVAAAMRFSEIVFLVPGAVHLALDRRFRHAALFAGTLLGTAAAIQAGSDVLYWGSPFFSAQRMVDYTIVTGQSSRGFEPVWAYLTGIPDWSDLVIVGLALLATVRGSTRVALWAWLPVLMLSALPHKEARYLVPVMPFVALLAGQAISALVARIDDGERVRPAVAGGLALALVVGLSASAALNASRYHVRRDDGAIDTARRLAAMAPAQGIAVEQLWRLGGRLYIGALPVREVRPSELTSAGVAALSADAELGWVLLRRDTCGRLSCDALLSSAGFAERPDVAGASEYRVFARGRR